MRDGGICSNEYPPNPFTDISITDQYANEVDNIYYEGISAGCNTSPLQYCPSSTTLRQQMAVFIVTSLLIAEAQSPTSFSYTTTPYFNDVPNTSPYFKFVQKLKDLGITGGCSVSPPLFCPTSNVTNGQMAVFTMVAWELRTGSGLGTYTTTPYYTDVPSTHPFFPFIQKATDLNIFKPINLCGPNMFCPDTNNITRGQSAIDIVRGIMGITSWSITSTNLTDLQTCIGPFGNPNSGTCILSPTSYTVHLTPGYLLIGRSNVTISGGGGPGDTTLVRGDQSLPYIMRNNGASNVTISNLTFDGNRYGFGTGGVGNSCLIGNAPFYDLDTSGGAVTVEWVDFINAPGTALVVGGAGSTVSVSNFGQGGYGIAPDSTFRHESCAESATRSTAVYVTDGTGAWYNAISYAGTAGITLSGNGQYAYGNFLFNNRYEISDWYVGPPTVACPGGTSQHCLQQGGQLTLTGDLTQTLSGGCPGYTCSSDASVAGNVIIGNNWPPLTGPYPAQATGCPWGSGSAFNAGIEAYGFGHSFYNNEVNTTTGSGMQLAGSNPTGNITISSLNPFNPSDPTRAIEGNANGGIVFLGPITNSSFTYSAVGVSLNDVIAQNNQKFGVVLDTVSNYSSYTGFINNACITGNPFGDTSPTSWTTLSNPLPANDNLFWGGTCPLSGYSVPAASHIAGWTW